MLMLDLLSTKMCSPLVAFVLLFYVFGSHYATQVVLGLQLTERIIYSMYYLA